MGAAAPGEVWGGGAAVTRASQWGLGCEASVSPPTEPTSRITANNKALLVG